MRNLLFIAALLTGSAQAATVDLFTATQHFDKEKASALNQKHTSFMLNTGKFKAGAFLNSYERTMWAGGYQVAGGRFGKLYVGAMFNKDGYCDSCYYGRKVIPLAIAESPAYYFGETGMYIKATLYGDQAIGATLGVVL